MAQAATVLSFGSWLCRSTLTYLVYCWHPPPCVPEAFHHIPGFWPVRQTCGHNQSRCTQTSSHCRSYATAEDLPTAVFPASAPCKHCMAMVWDLACACKPLLHPCSPQLHPWGTPLSSYTLPLQEAVAGVLFWPPTYHSQSPAPLGAAPPLLALPFAGPPSVSPGSTLLLHLL